MDILQSQERENINNKNELIRFISIKSKNPFDSFYISNVLLKHCIENKGIIYLDKAYNEILRFCPNFNYKSFDRFILRLTINTKEFIRRKRNTCPLFYKENKNMLRVLHPNSLIGEYACKIKYELIYEKYKSSHETRKDFEYYIDEINKIKLSETTEVKYLKIMRDEYIKDDNVLIDFKVFSKRINSIANLIHLKNTTIITKTATASLDYDSIYAVEEKEVIERETGKSINISEMYKGRKGYVYIVYNKYIPGLVKIGRTHRKDINLRISELSNTNVPGNYELIEKILTIDAVYLEKLLHTFYKKKNESKEFFKLNDEEINEVIKTGYIYR